MELDLENEKVQITKEDGQIVECDILFTFDSDDTKKTYVAYTEHQKDENDKMNIYVSSYNPLLPKSHLEDVKDERELEMVNQVIEDIKAGKY